MHVHTCQTRAAVIGDIYIWIWRASYRIGGLLTSYARNVVRDHYKSNSWNSSSHHIDHAYKRQNDRISVAYSSTWSNDSTHFVIYYAIVFHAYTEVTISIKSSWFYMHNLYDESINPTIWYIKYNLKPYHFCGKGGYYLLAKGGPLFPLYIYIAQVLKHWPNTWFSTLSS